MVQDPPSWYKWSFILRVGISSWIIECIQNDYLPPRIGCWLFLKGKISVHSLEDICQRSYKQAIITYNLLEAKEAKTKHEIETLFEESHLQNIARASKTPLKIRTVTDLWEPTKTNTDT